MSSFDRIEQYGDVHVIAINAAAIDRPAEILSAQ